MISIEQINGEIAALEEQIPTHVIMQRLASLYTVRDHMGIVKKDNPSVSVVELDVFPEYGISEFLTTIAGKDVRSVIMQIDEMMTATQVLNPRLYDSVIRGLNDTH